MEDKTRIELRSEKIRSIIGPIPKKLVWCGYIIIVTITVFLIIGLFLFSNYFG